MVRWTTIGLAVLGFLAGVYTVATAGRDEPEPPPVAPPSMNPFASGIAATGVVEAATRNIAIAPPEPGLVMTVFVGVNDEVAAGQPLFGLDDRRLEADLQVAQAQVGVALADEEFQRLELERIREVHQRGAATVQELARQEAQFKSAAAQVDAAKAQVVSLRTQIDRLTVKSPIKGTVLKRNIEPGEYATPSTGDPAMVVGDLSELRVRAQVDEEDAPRLKMGSRAVLRVRGSIDARVELQMLRIEPLATAKQQLSGDVLERIDTRVVEVVLKVVGRSEVPIYPGQVVDVFIEGEAPPEHRPRVTPQE